jgi:pimeloyl-ACP methyl ester carboxylesterase
MQESTMISEVAAVVVRSLACGDYTEGAGQFIDYWSGPGAWAAISQGRQAAFAARLAKVALDFQATIHEPPWPRDFERIAVPTLLMQGEHSPLPALRVCQRLARTLQGLSIKTVRGAGHMAPLTHCDEVNDQIAAHLEACSLTRRAEP